MHSSSVARFAAFVLIVPVVMAAAGAGPSDKPAGGDRSGGPAVSPDTRPADRVDLNNATAEELDKLPGIGEANAKKIIRHRPYESVKDLTKAGLGDKLTEKLEPLVYVYRHPLPHGSPAGLVWVNTATGVYHLETDPWYGRSKEGKYMTIDEAKKAGYHESREAKAKDADEPKAAAEHGK